MSASWRIALRYLFAKKRHNAINIVSGVAAAGIAVTTAAMIVVLSVMNGFGSLVESMFSLFDPDLRVEVVEGKSFSIDNHAFAQIQAMPEVEVFSKTIEEMALVQYSGKQVTAKIKGVDDNYEQLTGIDSILVDGEYSVYDGAFERAVLGIGLANTIGIGAHFVSGMRLYAPKRTERVNMLSPERSLNKESVFISAIFAVNQVKYDDSYMLTSLQLAQSLFEYTDDEVTAVELKLSSYAKPKQAKRKIQALLGEQYRVLDRYEQQADFFKIYEVEKLLTILLLSFILLIASINIIGSLSMLIIDKKEDISILRSMGADNSQLRRIFLYEGQMVSAMGAVIGVVVGVLLCYLQQEYGLIKLGDGQTFIISYYPVELQLADVLLTLLIVLLLGWLTAFVPARRVGTNFTVWLLPCMLFLASCGDKNKTPLVSPYQTELNKGYATFYGKYYQEGGVEFHVLSLDLYSAGIKIDKDMHIEGEGTNVYLSDIFLPSTDSLLTATTYHSNSAAAEFHFLLGIDYHDYIQNAYSGAYLLQLHENGGFEVVTVKEGTMEVTLQGDSTIINFQLIINDKDFPVYKGQYRGKLKYLDGRHIQRIQHLP